MKNLIQKNKSKIIKVESIRVGLASPENIKKWAERTLPNGKILGQVTNSQTVNYKTLKPEKGGLFCERIFGPIKDFECACGKKKTKLNQKFCSECDVEFTFSRVRRHKLGYISLISPVTHVWYLKGTPSYISVLLDLPKKKIEAITYCTETINLSAIKNREFTIAKPFFVTNQNEVYKNNLPKLESVVPSKTPFQSSIKNNGFIPFANSYAPREAIEEGIIINNNPEFDISLAPGRTKKSILNNYYAISQDCSWELPDDWNFFIYYITSFPNQKDIPIPYYLNRITKFDNISLGLTTSFATQTNISLIGGEAIRTLLLNLDLPLLDRQIRVELFELNEEMGDLEVQGFLLFSEHRRLQFLQYMRAKKLRRLKLIRHFRRTKTKPEWMILSILPVLPPDLRPIIQLDGDQVAVSDLNKLYQKVLFRNNRMKRHKRINSSTISFSGARKVSGHKVSSAASEATTSVATNDSQNSISPPSNFNSFAKAGSEVNTNGYSTERNSYKIKPLPFTQIKFTNLSNSLATTTRSFASDEIKYAQRLLQEAVDALIENGKGGSDPICASNDRPLKSLSDLLKGKKGRFRQNLLGKRVDYSGRSVIVVGPQLKIHQCGLPKEMAIELFQPFLIRRLMSNKIVRTIIGAKRLIQLQDPVIWETLTEVMQNHPVLLNRAPTLHRLGIQAFQPLLVDGRAILLHPLVCTSFNADFDGDQMAVHIPLSFEARSEAWKLMWSRNNLLSPSTGQPIIVPSQDMVLGCYYLTTNNLRTAKFIQNYFSNFDNVIRAYYQKKIDLHNFIWVRWNHLFETVFEFEKPLEIRISLFGTRTHIYSTYQHYFDKNGNQISQIIRTTPGRILLNQLLSNSFS